MRVPPLLLTALLALPCPATIAVLQYDGRSLVVAADSRALDVQQHPTDDACKIANIANQAVFVTSGALGFRDYMERAVSPSRPLQQIAETFAQSVADHFARLAQINSAEIERLTTINGGGLLTAIVIGADLRAFEIRIDGTPQQIDWHVNPIPRCSTRGVCAIGQVDTIQRQTRRRSPQELVELTARDHPSEVGGPTDLLEWKRGQPPKWISRKPACPAQ